MSKYLECPECGNNEFEEVSLCWTRQAEVKIKTTGKPDYETAGGIEVEDTPSIGQSYYKCPECDSEFIVSKRKLQKHCP